MKTAEEVFNENWGHHTEAPYDIVLESMEQYADFKSKEYQEAIIYLHGMTRYYLEFVKNSEETDPIRIESKNDFVDIMTSHLKKYQHLMPEIDYKDSPQIIEKIRNMCYTVL